MNGKHVPPRGGSAALARGWLVALRIARREARRAKGRTALVVLMIALPVAALSFAAATYDMYRLTPQEQVTRQMGAADALVDWSGDQRITMTPDGNVEVAPPASAPGEGSGRDVSTPAVTHDAAALLAHAPPGSQVTPYVQGSVVVRTAAGIGSLTAYGIDLTSPITTGLVHIDSGRAPRTDAEVLASPAAMDRLGVKVGATITPTSGADGAFAQHVYTIVGVAEVGASLDQYLVFRPTAATAPVTQWLVSSPVPFTVDRINALGALGVQVNSRYLDLHPLPAMRRPSSPTLAGFSIFGIGTIIAGLGLFEVVLLAGPAFAVGARRRQRDLALVAASGGTPATMRRIVLSDGIVSGLAAAAIGLVIGLAAAMAGRPVLENYLLHARFGGYRIYPLAIVAVIALAIATGLLGALVPAVTASRQDVVASLSGRRGITRSRRRWIGLGAAAVACGAAATLFGAYRHNSPIVLAGLLIGQFGAVLWTPALVGAIGRLGRFLPVAARIALRDTSRRRAAAAPAISAVMAAVAGSVALTVYLGASADQPSRYRPMLPVGSFTIDMPKWAADLPADRITNAIGTIVPGSHVVTVTTDDPTAVFVAPDLPAAARCPWADATGPLSAADQRRALADKRCTDSDTGAGMFGAIVTTDPDVLATTLGLSGAELDEAVRTLNGGGVLVDESQFVSGGHVHLHIEQWTADGSAGEDTTVTLPGYGFDSGLGLEVAISPATAERLKIPTTTYGMAATPPAPLTQRQDDALRAALVDMSTDQVQPGLYVEEGPEHPSQLVGLVLAAAAGVIALGAAAIGTGLGAVDGRRDLRTLGAIGATPSIRKRLALAQAGVIAGLGSLLGALVGFGAGAAVLFGLNQVWAGKWPMIEPPYPIEVPWRNLAISVIVVPLVAMLGATIFTRSRLPIERRPE